MDRSLFLVDIENLAGDGLDAHGLALDRLARCLALAKHKPGDLSVVASGRRLWKKLAFDVRQWGCRWVVVNALRDAADRALIDAAHDYNLATFDSLVIGSGDHIFTGLAEEAGEAGLKVVAIGPDGGVSKTLSRAADQTIRLPPIDWYRKPRPSSRRPHAKATVGQAASPGPCDV